MTPFGNRDELVKILSALWDEIFNTPEITRKVASEKLIVKFRLTDIGLNLFINLTGDDDFGEMWRATLPAVNRYLADEHGGRLWYGHADMRSGRRTATRFGALDAFLPAVLALAGDTSRAERLMTSVFDMWTAFDIEPEQWDYVTGEVVSPPYFLRPEALESAYHLHRLTNDPRYLRMGKVMFESILAHTQNEVGFTALESVVTKARADAMESFFLAETLKYAFLLFADSNIANTGDAVFNTEAHPIWKTWD